MLRAAEAGAANTRPGMHSNRTHIHGDLCCIAYFLPAFLPVPIAFFTFTAFLPTFFFVEIGPFFFAMPPVAPGAAVIATFFFGAFFGAFFVPAFGLLPDFFGFFVAFFAAFAGMPPRRTSSSSIVGLRGRSVRVCEGAWWVTRVTSKDGGFSGRRAVARKFWRACGGSYDWSCVHEAHEDEVCAC